MDIGAYFESELDEHGDTLAASRAALHEPFTRLVSLAVRSIRGDGKILFFGNGGSAADAQHLAAELAVRYISDRAPLPGIALTTDTSALTAAGNDYGLEEVFARQLAALGRPGDVAIGISTSGQSENVIRALVKARQMEVVPAAFGGKGGGRMNEVADPYLVVPSANTAWIQEMHITLGHMLCGALERELGLV